MNALWTNRLGLSFAAAGVVLMALTISWHVNPAEGSVVPRFLTANLAGTAALWVLLVTCMPVWVVAVWLSSLIPVSDRLQYLPRMRSHAGAPGSGVFSGWETSFSLDPQTEGKEGNIEPRSVCDAVTCAPDSWR